MAGVEVAEHDRDAHGADVVDAFARSGGVVALEARLETAAARTAVTVPEIAVITLFSENDTVAAA
jgi:hypothetical protein